MEDEFPAQPPQVGRWGCYPCRLPPQMGSQGEDQFRPGPANIGVCVTNAE